MNQSSVLDERELQAGGPLDPSHHVYISRPEDVELMRLLRSGEYVNVVTSRQMGKTSLFYRAAAQLAPEGFHFAILDLTSLGHEPEARRYFRTLTGELAKQLALDIDLDLFWAEGIDKTSSQCFIDFFRRVLELLSGPIVIVFDEIDYTLESSKLKYTDDLFTAIRSMYTRRPNEPAFKRLSFCLVGVATPNELIKARRTTPYNIGRTIWLADFDPARDDLSPLASAMSHDPQIGQQLLARVLYWTGGQPYLTVWIADELRRAHATDPAAVDAFVERTFISLESLRSDSHFESILRFVNSRLKDGAAVLNLYERILQGRREVDQAANLAYAHLKLSGLVKRASDGTLVVRNRIYERLFNLEWVRKSRPKQELRLYRRFAVAAFGALVVVMAIGVVLYQVEWVPVKAQAAASEKLKNLGMKVIRDSDGWTVASLPEQETHTVLFQAMPVLATMNRATFFSKGLKLDLSRRKIGDLTVLAPLTGLQALDVSNTQVQNLAPLIELKSLQWLNVGGTQVDDLAPLANLTKLKRLYAPSTKVVDLASLANLNNLESLAVGNTQVKNLTPLAKVTTLQELSAFSTQVDDLAPLASLSRLRELDVSGTRVPELAPLTKLLRLERLDIARTQVQDLTPLTKLTRLRTLDVSGTRVTDFTPLANLGSLEDLDLSRTQFRDPALLASLTSLQRLDVSRAPVRDLAPLAKLTKLESLLLSGTGVQDLGPIANLTELTRLDLRHTPVDNLAPLANLSNLYELDMSGTRVTDFTPIANLTGLWTLRASDTQLKDLAPLAQLVRLETLHVANTQVVDFTPLARLTNLKWLDVSSTQISDLSPLARLTTLTDLNVSQTQVKDLTPLKELLNLRSLNVYRAPIADFSRLSGNRNLVIESWPRRRGADFDF